MKSPDSGVVAMMLGYLRRLPVRVLPAADSSSALGVLSVHRSGLEAALFQPAHDLVLGEADVRFDPHIRYKSALDLIGVTESEMLAVMTGR